MNAGGKALLGNASAKDVIVQGYLAHKKPELQNPKPESQVGREALLGNATASDVIVIVEYTHTNTHRFDTHTNSHRIGWIRQQNTTFGVNKLSGIQRLGWINTG